MKKDGRRKTIMLKHKNKNPFYIYAPYAYASLYTIHTTTTPFTLPNFYYIQNENPAGTREEEK